MEVLAEAAGQLPAGTSSGNIMPGLSNLGAGGARHIQHQVWGQEFAAGREVVCQKFLISEGVRGHTFPAPLPFGGVSDD